MNDRPPEMDAAGAVPKRPRKQGNLFRFSSGSRFESCGVAAIDCPHCGVRTLADGVSVKDANGLRETHRHVRCRLCGAPSQLKDGVTLLTDGLPPEDSVCPSEPFIARSQPRLLEPSLPEASKAPEVADPVDAESPGGAKGAGNAPRHQRAVLYGIRYEFEKPRDMAWSAYVVPFPFGGLLTIGLLSYGVLSLMTWSGATQTAAITVTGSVGLFLLLAGLSLRRTNQRIAATREVCAPYLWRTIARFGGTQEEFRDLAGRLGEEFVWIRNALTEPMPFMEVREETAEVPVAAALNGCVNAEPSEETIKAATPVRPTDPGEQTGPPVPDTPGMPEVQGVRPVPPVSGLEQAVLTALAEQPKPRSAQQGWMLLFISLFLFVSLGWLGGLAERIVLLAVLIAIHEGGHYLAMRLFGYRDVRVFFIPFLGGATMASDTQHAPEWKQAIVSLAGPLPGMAIGLLLGAGWAATGNGLLGQSALFFILLNGFNLLPFLPLDGGHFFDHVIFCRHRTLEAVFRVVAALGLFGLAILMGAWILAGIALLPLLSLANFLKTTRVADELKRVSPPPEDGLPPVPSREIALAILPLIQKTFPQMREPKLLADQMRLVWGYYGTRPPGLGATVALLAAYVMSIAAVAVLGAVVLFAGSTRAGNRFDALMDDGNVSMASADYDQAEKAFGEAVEASSQLLHDRVARPRALCKQAVALQRLGALKGAERALAAAEADLGEIPGLQRMYLVEVYELRGNLYLAEGRADEAVYWYRSAMDLYRQYLGEGCSEAKKLRLRAAEQLQERGFTDHVESLDHPPSVKEERAPSPGREDVSTPP